MFKILINYWSPKQTFWRRGADRNIIHLQVSCKQNKQSRPSQAKIYKYKLKLKRIRFKSLEHNHKSIHFRRGTWINRKPNRYCRSKRKLKIRLAWAWLVLQIARHRHLWHSQNQYKQTKNAYHLAQLSKSLPSLHSNKSKMWGHHSCQMEQSHLQRDWVTNLASKRPLRVIHLNQLDRKKTRSLKTSTSNAQRASIILKLSRCFKTKPIYIKFLAHNSWKTQVLGLINKDLHQAIRRIPQASLWTKI